MLLKKMIKSKMGVDVPDEQVDMILVMVQQNPELFKKIGSEIEEKVKQGKDQQTATMEVMRAHESELKGLNINK